MSKIETTIHHVATLDMGPIVKSKRSNDGTYYYTRRIYVDVKPNSWDAVDEYGDPRDNEFVLELELFADSKKDLVAHRFDGGVRV